MLNDLGSPWAPRRLGTWRWNRNILWPASPSLGVATVIFTKGNSAISHPPLNPGVWQVLDIKGGWELCLLNLCVLWKRPCLKMVKAILGLETCDLGDHPNRWRFPEMGVPQVLIHFRLGFSLKSTIRRTWGTPMAMETPGKKEHVQFKCRKHSQWRKAKCPWSTVWLRTGFPVQWWSLINLSDGIIPCNEEGIWSCVEAAAHLDMSSWSFSQWKSSKGTGALKRWFFFSGIVWHRQMYPSLQGSSGTQLSKSLHPNYSILAVSMWSRDITHSHSSQNSSINPSNIRWI